MEWVVDGLQDLRSFLASNAVQSIALPALGAGLGGLPWAAVREHIEAALGDLPVDVRVYEPL
jgi:O-acetyl-ADP-ribose deacetylase (regulator of RNase III)